MQIVISPVAIRRPMMLTVGRFVISARAKLGVGGNSLNVRLSIGTPKRRLVGYAELGCGRGIASLRWL